MRRVATLEKRRQASRRGAMVSLRPGKTAAEAELREFARQRLNDLKVPEKILFLAELPKGFSGKVDRRALKESAKV